MSDNPTNVTSLFEKKTKLRFRFPKIHFPQSRKWNLLIIAAVLVVTLWLAQVPRV